MKLLVVLLLHLTIIVLCSADYDRDHGNRRNSNRNNDQNNWNNRNSKWGNNHRRESSNSRENSNRGKNNGRHNSNWDNKRDRDDSSWGNKRDRDDSNWGNKRDRDNSNWGNKRDRDNSNWGNKNDRDDSNWGNNNFDRENSKRNHNRELGSERQGGDSTQEVDDKSEEVIVRPQGVRPKSVKPTTPMKASVQMPSGKRYKLSDPKLPRDMGCQDNAELLEVKSTRKEYKTIESELKGTSGNYTVNVIKIEKILNKCVWERYVHRRGSILHESEDHVANERLLFHGGGRHTYNLLNKGFDERFAYSPKNGVTGLYFQKDASWSNRWAKVSKNGSRALLFCRVALGREHIVERGANLMHPPVGYHSIVFNADGTYVVTRGEQIYPEYLITYEVTSSTYDAADEDHPY